MTHQPRSQVAPGYATCEALTREVAGNFSLGIHLLPQNRRRALASIYWFSHRADAAVDEVDTPGERRARLDDVRREFEASIDHRPPLAPWAALADAIEQFEIPIRLFHSLLDGVGRDIEPARHATWEEARAYCYGVASVVGLISLRVFGGHGAVAEAAAEQIGYALQLTNMLRDMREDASIGRWYLPMDETDRFGIVPDDVANGCAGPGFEPFVAVQIERARAFYGAGPDLYRRLPFSTRSSPAALVGVYRGLLERIAVDPRRTLRGRTRLPSFLKIGHGLSAAVRSWAE